MRLIGYCRVSTNNQREEGTIEIQRKALQEFVESNDHELAEIFSDDGISGSKKLENRPGLSAMFDCLEVSPEIEGVLIYKLDRLARDLYIQEHLMKKLERVKKRLISIKEPNLDSSDPMRKAFRQFMGIVSELEKAFITMRLSGGRINKARKGGYAGGCPGLGYQAIDNSLIIDPESSETVKAIFSLRAQGLSLRAIADYLNEENIPSARGGQWHASTIQYMLNNTLYQGTLKYTNIQVHKTDLSLM